MTTRNERKDSSMNTKCGYEHQWLTKLSKRGVRGAVALLLLLPVAAWAGGVVTNCTEADLRAAMDGGGVVTFACDGTIGLANTISNSLDTVLDASGHRVAIAGNRVRVFYVNGNVRFTVVNLTISGGLSGGGSAILNNGGTVNLTGVAFSGNAATIFVANDPLGGGGRRGAIFNPSGTVAASKCSFVGNSAWTPGAWTGLGYPWGGAIYNLGQLDLQSCVFVDNHASGGSATVPGPGSSSGDSAYGGAIYNSGTATLDLCTFTGNSATGGSGGGSVAVHIPGGWGGEAAGGAVDGGGTLMVNRSTFCGNTATGGTGGPGGGADPNGSTLNGFAGGGGGNAYGGAIRGGGLITCSTLVSNVAIGGNGGNGGGGGIDTHSDFGGNGAPGGNGGSGFGGLAGVAVNCTIVFNTGSGGAGGAGGGGAWAIVQGGSGVTGG